ncbi:MAG: hypothetical protein K1X79_07650 [Oligoflexia bacterium]|nr:hypothetical protein [Oligoflexia bacterium]
MPINFNTGIYAAGALRALDSASARLARSYERLSSGMRINRASDDAGGLAVASSLNVENRVLNRANRNISDGISSLQQLDSTYGAASSLLQRMGELATQSANGSLSLSQRSSLNLEYQQLDAEIRRLAKQTTFNGIQLADGKQSARAATALSSTSPSSILGVSSDGRVITYIASSRIEQYDTTTGTTTALTGTLSGSITGKAVAGGNIVVFTSTSDLTGQNSSNKNQIFMIDRANGTTRQLTSNTNSGLSYAIGAVSDEGNSILYSTYASLTMSYYVYQSQTSTSTLITATPAPGTVVWNFSSDGAYLAGMADLTGDGQSEVYRYRVGQPASNFQKLTDFLGSGIGAPVDTEVAVGNNGTIYFFSPGNINGLNSTGSNQLFSLDTSGTYRKLGTASTNTTPYQLRVVPDGSAVVFLSAANYGSNSSGVTQLFRYEFSDNSINQKTNYTSNTLGSATGGAISTDGNSIVYSSSGLKQIDLSPERYDLSIDLGIRGSNGSITALLDAINGSLRGLGATRIGYQASAKGAIDLVNRNLDQLGVARGNLGAYLSRLEAAQSLIANRAEEGEAARSRITDADLAQETANALRESILRQTSSAMLAQANGSSQIALQLLIGATG